MLSHIVNVEIIWAGNFAGSSGINCKVIRRTGHHTIEGSIISIERRIDRTLRNTGLSGGIAELIKRRPPWACSVAVIVAGISKGILTDGAQCDALPGIVISVDIGGGAAGPHYAQSLHWVTILSGNRASLFTDIPTSDISEVAGRAQRHTEVVRAVLKRRIRACCIADMEIGVSKETTGA